MIGGDIDLPGKFLKVMEIFPLSASFRYSTAFLLSAVEKQPQPDRQTLLTRSRCSVHLPIIE